MRIKIIGTPYGWTQNGMTVRAKLLKGFEIVSGVRVLSQAVRKENKRTKGCDYNLSVHSKIAWYLSKSLTISTGSLEILPLCKAKPKRRRGAVGGRKF